MFRQGDVLLIPVAAIPPRAKAVEAEGGRIVLAYGEATGHAHAIAAPGARLFSEGTNRFLEVSAGGATLAHEEHAAIPLPAGAYRVILQREYSPEENRPVAD